MKLNQNYLKNICFYENGKLIRRFSSGNRQAMTPMGSVRSSGISKNRREVWLGSKKDGKSYLNSHLIWLYHYGYLPEMLGHLNHDVSDDRIENLAENTRSQQQDTGKAMKSSKLGSRGIQMQKQGTFMAHIAINGVKTYLGTFKTLAKAEKAYADAREAKNE